MLSVTFALLPLFTATKQAHGDAYAYGFATAIADIEEEDNFDDASMLSFSHESAARYNPTAAVAPDAYAFAKSYGHAFGSSGVYAEAGGTGLNVPADGWGWIRARTASASFSEYRIESAALAVGTPVTIDMTFHYDGTVSLRRDSAGRFDASAWVLADNQIGENGEGMSIVYLGGIDLYGDGSAYDSGDWQDAATFSSDATDLLTATIDVTHTVSYQTTVGSTIQFSPNISAEAMVDVPGDGALAIVDFYNTSRYMLAPAAGQDFRVIAMDAVPEPAALLALSSASVALSARRRRR